LHQPLDRDCGSFDSDAMAKLLQGIVVEPRHCTVERNGLTVAVRTMQQKLQPPQSSSFFFLLARAGVLCYCLGVPASTSPGC
jgi:hypothetical protein